MPAAPRLPVLAVAALCGALAAAPAAGAKGIARVAVCGAAGCVDRTDVALGQSSETHLLLGAGARGQPRRGDARAVRARALRHRGRHEPQGVRPLHGRLPAAVGAPAFRGRDLGAPGGRRAAARAGARHPARDPAAQARRDRRRDRAGADRRATGLWFPAPHAYLRAAPDGGFRERPPARSGPSLVWEQAGLVLRLERRRLTRARALAVARSARPHRLR